MSWKQVAAFFREHARVVDEHEHRLIAVWKDDSGRGVQTLVAVLDPADGGLWLVGDVVDVRGVDSRVLAARRTAAGRALAVVGTMLFVRTRIAASRLSKATLEKASLVTVLRASSLRRELTVTAEMVSNMFAAFAE